MAKRTRSSKKATQTKFANALRKLSSLRSSQRTQALKLANDSFIRQFCNNVKKLRKVPLSPSLQKRFRKQSKNLRKLVNAKTSVRVKRDMLTQRGGFLPFLIPLLTSVAGSIIGALRK